MIARKAMAIIEFAAEIFVITELSFRATKGTPGEEGIILMMTIMLAIPVTKKMLKEIMKQK